MRCCNDVWAVLAAAMIAFVAAHAGAEFLDVADAEAKLLDLGGTDEGLSNLGGSPKQPPVGFHKVYHASDYPMIASDDTVLLKDAQGIRIKPKVFGNVLYGPYEKDLSVFSGEMLLSVAMTISDNGRGPKGGNKKGKRTRKPSGDPHDVIAEIWVFVCCGEDSYHEPAKLYVRRGDFGVSSGTNHAASKGNATHFYLPFRISPYYMEAQQKGLEFTVKAFGKADFAIFDLTVTAYDDQTIRKHVKGLARGPAAAYDFIPASSHRSSHHHGREVRIPAEDLGYSLARHYDYAHALGILNNDESTTSGIAGWHLFIGEGGSSPHMSFGPYTKYAVKGKLIPATVFLRVGAGSGVDNSPNGGGGVIVDRQAARGLARDSYNWLGWAGHRYDITVDVVTRDKHNNELVLMRRDLVIDNFRRLHRNELKWKLGKMKRQKQSKDQKGKQKKDKKKSPKDDHFQGHFMGQSKLITYYMDAYQHALTALTTPEELRKSGDLLDSYYFTPGEKADLIDEMLQLPLTFPVHLLFRPPEDDSSIEIRVQIKNGQMGQLMHLATVIGLPPATMEKDEEKIERGEKDKKKGKKGANASQAPSPSPSRKPSPSPSPSASPSAEEAEEETPVGVSCYGWWQC
jgi:hypothetical protein